MKDYEMSIVNLQMRFHPKRGLFYVLLASSAFSERVCDRIGAASNCYVHYTASLSNPLRPC